MQTQLVLVCVVLLALADSQTPTSQGITATTTKLPTASDSSASGGALPATLGYQTNPPALSTTLDAFIGNSTLPANAGTSGRSPDWLNGILAFANQLAIAPRLQAAAENSSQVVNGLMGQLPGLVQGLGAANLQGNDAAQLLAGLFSDPRTEGIPAWIEALMAPGSNTSLSLKDAQTLLQSFSQQDPNDQLQTLLARVFTDVTQGLQSLNVTANSTSQDVISAMMNDPGLMSSLSSDAQQMMGVMGGSEVLQQLLQQQFPVDPESQCAADLSALGSGLQQGDMWALQMLDATGKLQAGLLTGQTTLFGDYDECLDISHVNGSHTIQGQFCSVTMAIPEFMASSLAAAQTPNARLHLCLPNSCANQQQINFLLQPTIGALESELQGVYCYPKPDPSGDPWFTGTLVTLGILTLLCAAGTAYGTIVDRKKDKQQTLAVKVASNGHTNSTCTKDDGVHVHDELTNGHVDSKEGEVEGGKTKGKDGSVGGTNGMANKENGGVITKDGAVKSGERSSAEESLPSQLLLSFSVLRNGRKVLNCDKNSADISCLHGIRVLSITWVVLGHSFSLVQPAVGNIGSGQGLLEHFTMMAIMGGMFAVDTFFFLSGFLSAFLFLRTTKKTGHLTVSGVVLYYIHRIWRLTPIYAVLLLVYIGIFPYMKEGPFQNQLGMDSETACRDYWYFNLLYVNNVVDVNKMCFGWSWYLSNDMQFSFLAPLVLIPWCFRGRVKVVGFVLAAAMIATHCIVNGVKVADLGSWSNPKYSQEVYIKPWCRVGPYAVGLNLGYILHVTRGKYTMTKMTWTLGWTMATAVGLTLVYVLHDNFANTTTEGNHWGAADFTAYDSLCRVLWAVCVSWVVFACTTGYGGFVNTLLSWSAWAPLSRLSYGVYLVHVIVLYVIAGNAKKFIFLDAWTATELYLAATVLSFLLSFVFSMLVEAPTLGLEKAVLGKIFGKRK